MTGPIEHWISIVEPRHSWLRLSASERAQILDCGITGISVRAGRPGDEEVAREVLASGLRLSIEQWSTASPPTSERISREDGRRAGERIASAARRLNADSYRINAEHEIWRYHPSARTKAKANPYADEYLDELVRAAEAQLADLDHKPYPEYLGFAAPSEHYPTRDEDGDGHPDNTIPRYVRDQHLGVWRMAYQSSEAVIRRSLDRARKQWPDHWLGAYASPGRLGVKGEVIGNADAWRAIIADRHAGLAAVTWYVGLDQRAPAQDPWEMLIRGNRKQPPLVDLIRELTA